jgi:hypothetical protein
VTVRKSNRVDSFKRQTHTLLRDQARAMAKSWFKRFPKAAYDTKVESWRLTADGNVVFTMRRLPTAG